MSNTATYKQTPIGLIPKDWGTKQLGDICEIFLGLTYTPEYTSEGVPFLSVKDINGGVINFSKTRFISESEFKNSTKNAKPQKGDILFGRVGTLGNPILIEENIDFCIFVSLGYLRLKKENFDRNFLIHWMWSDIFTKQVDSEVSGSSQKNLNTGWLKKFLLTNPPILEQQKIAQILSTWDAAIDNCKAIINHLQERNKGLAQQLLTGKMRVVGFEKKWRLIPLNECLKYTPREVSKPSGSYLALGLRSHGKGIFHKHDIDPEDVAMDVLYEVKENDLIINITFAWEQAVAIVSKQDEGGLVSHRFPTYTFNTDKAIPEFFRHFILQKYFKFLMELISPGGAGRNRVMSKTDFLKLEVKLPDVKEQKAIANILNTATAELSQYQQKLQFLQQQKKGLMQQLLTGKTRVKI